MLKIFTYSHSIILSEINKSHNIEMVNYFNKFNLYTLVKFSYVYTYILKAYLNLIHLKWRDYVGLN